MSSMVSEPPRAMDCDADVVDEQPVAGSVVNNHILLAKCIPNKKNLGKVPKKIHKAEREKLKRDQLNELFLELGHALEPAPKNSGKASILTDATRILRDLILQVESLRKENVALVTESCYVTVEKNELKDENVALAAETARLHNEFRERLNFDPAWQNNGTDQTTRVQPTSTTIPVPQPHVAPLYVIPFHQDLQNLPETAITLSPSKPVPQVIRPHARYPTPSVSLPLQILSRHQHSGSANSEDEVSEKA